VENTKTKVLDDDTQSNCRKINQKMGISMSVRSGGGTKVLLRKQLWNYQFHIKET